MSSKTLTASIVKKYIPTRRSNSRKGDNGKVLVVGGSYMYHGAPILSSLAALRAGADLKSHEGMVFGEMYADWKKRKGYE